MAGLRLKLRFDSKSQVCTSLPCPSTPGAQGSGLMGSAVSLCEALLNVPFSRIGILHFFLKSGMKSATSKTLRGPRQQFPPFQTRKLSLAMPNATQLTALRDRASGSSD